MTPSELNKSIKARKFENAYFLFGAESFLMEEALNSLIQAVVDPATRDFNFDLFYGGEVDAGKVVDTAKSYPMMADARMVVVKEAHKLAPSGLDILNQYLEKPAPSTRLVLLSEKADRRQKTINKIKTKTCCVEFKPLYDRQIPSWIRDYLRGQGYQISDEAALLIHSRVGTQLREITNELEKITLNLGENRKIEIEDIQKIVGLTRNFTIFDLNDAIGDKDLHKSLTILNQMLGSGESATVILARTTRLFSDLLKIKGARAQGKGTEEVASLTGIPTFFVKKSVRQAGNYSWPELGHAFEALLETDLILKTSQQTPVIAMQSLMTRIIGNHHL